MTARESLQQLFQASLELPPDAAAWLLALWDVIQVFDDVVDNDAVARADLDRAIFTSLVGLPANTFFQTHGTSLLPILATAILKWKASDDAEREGSADEKSFVWRASYYDVVLAVVLLCHGQTAAMGAANHVMKMYGESFADYRKEFNHA